MAILERSTPVYTAPLLRPLLGELLDLLGGLTAEQWEAPTVAGAWRVRDVAGHLLDGELRKLAVYRDRHLLPLEAPIRTDRDLARLVNALNAEGWRGHGGSARGCSSTCSRTRGRGRPTCWRRSAA